MLPNDTWNSSLTSPFIPGGVLDRMGHQWGAGFQVPSERVYVWTVLEALNPSNSLRRTFLARLSPASPSPTRQSAVVFCYSPKACTDCEGFDRSPFDLLNTGTAAKSYYDGGAVRAVTKCHFA